MRPSKYLNAFQSAEKSGSYKLHADAILVEKIPIEEKRTESGLILPTELPNKQVNSLAADLPIFVHVIAIGAGHYNEETGTDVPLNVEPGDVILVGSQSVKWFSLLDINKYEPYSIGLSREAEIILRFKGQEAYNSYFGEINKHLTGQVDGNAK